MGASISIDAPSQGEFDALAARVAALEASGGGGGSVAPFVWHANSGNFSERVTSLPIIDTTNATKRIIFSVQLPTLEAGDLVEAFSTFEVTNPQNYNIMVGRGLIVAATATDVTGTELSELAARNITPDMHHDHIQDFGSLIATAAMSQKFVNLVAYSDSTAAQPGHTAVVEQDYGRLFVKVTRKFALEN